MKCPSENKEEADLLALSAGKLEPARAAATEEHLKACSACSRFVEQQRAVWHALDGWEAPAVTPDFDRRLFQRIEENAGRRNWFGAFRTALLRHGLPVAAAACLIVAAGVVSQRSPDSAGPRQPQGTQVENLQPEQVEHAVDDLQMLSDFSRAARSDEDEL